MAKDKGWANCFTFAKGVFYFMKFNLYIQFFLKKKDYAWCYIRIYLMDCVDLVIDCFSALLWPLGSCNCAFLCTRVSLLLYYHCS